MLPSVLERDQKDAIQREAARILAALLDALHVVRPERQTVHIEAAVPLMLFDRLCIWGASNEDFEEDDPLEDGHDSEAEDYT